MSEYVPDRTDEPDDDEWRYGAHERRANQRRERDEAEFEAEREGDRS